MTDQGNEEPSPPGRRTMPESAGWSVLSTMLSGLILGVGAGWLLQRVTGQEWTVVIGLLAGMALAFYLIWMRYIRDDA